MTELVIIGAGGHGREVLQAARDAHEPIAGIIDDAAPDEDLLSRIDTEWLGPIPALAKFRGFRFLIGIGANHIRRKLDWMAIEGGLEPATLIHPLASVGMDVQLEPGCVIFQFSTLTTNIRVGRHTHIGRGSAVGHDSTLGDYVITFPLSAISGNVTVGDEATVGTTASIKQGLTIGAGATIGSGAAVVTDIPPYATAVGVPAELR